MEAIKLLTGLGEPLVGRLLIFDGKGMHFEEVRVNRRADCPVC
jgi:molybdopterin/thiamine biosynthesis adenylyltransferase